MLGNVHYKKNTFLKNVCLCCCCFVVAVFQNVFLHCICCPCLHFCCFVFFVVTLFLLSHCLSCCCPPSCPVYIASIHIDLCLSWDCQAKAALDSTFLLTTSRLSIWSNTTSTYLIIPPTTSRECTSIVQIVITWWFK